MIDLFKGFWDLQDMDRNGVTDGNDIPYPAGSINAKKAWMKIEQDAHNPENVTKAQKINPNASGMYGGRVLVSGESGTGQADFDFLKDKLHYYNGYSKTVAAKIAGKIKAGLYGR